MAEFIFGRSLKSHHLFKSYDKSAHQPQECHEMTYIYIYIRGNAQWYKWKEAEALTLTDISFHTNVSHLTCEALSASKVKISFRPVIATDHTVKPIANGDCQPIRYLSGLSTK